MSRNGVGIFSIILKSTALPVEIKRWALRELAKFRKLNLTLNYRVDVVSKSFGKKSGGRFRVLLSNICAFDVTSAYLSWIERHVFLDRLRFLLHVHLFRNPISRSNFTALYVFLFFVFCFMSRFLIFLLFKLLCFNSLKVSLDIGFFCFFLHSNFLFITFFFFPTWNEYVEFSEMYTIFFRNRRQLSHNKTLNERLVWFFWNRQSFMC